LPLTPLRFLERAGRLYADKSGVICGEKRFSYGEFCERCCRLASVLMKLGAQPGDRVAFLSPNCHRLLEAYYGVLLAKCVLLPLNIRLTASELAFILEDAEAKIIFFDPEFHSLVDALRRQLPGRTFVLLADVPGASDPDADRTAAHNAA